MNRGVKYVYFFKQNSIVFYAAKIKKQKTREYKLIGFRMLYGERVLDLVLTL